MKRFVFTTNEITAIDNIMLGNIQALEKLGAGDFADQRRDLRMRLLQLLENNHA